MLVSENLIFLELNKCGSSHARRILRDTLLPNIRILGKHQSIQDVVATGELAEEWNKKFIVGTIRNPFDFYVSLWAFGCSGKGRLYKAAVNVAKSKFAAIFQSERKDWKAVYADVHNPDLFRRWLQMLFDPNNTTLLAEPFVRSTFPLHCGYLTYKFIHLYTSGWPIEGVEKQTDLSSFFQKNNLTDLIFKLENFDIGFTKMATKIGFSPTEIKHTLRQYAKRTNPSERQPYHFYYDEESKALIAEKERFLLEEFGYGF